VPTHCSGPFGTGQLVVPAVPGSFGILDPGAGNRRGIIVVLHGGIGTSPGTVPQPTPSDTLSLDLQGDGWIVFQPAAPEDYVFTPGPSYMGALYNDVSNDAGHGSRYQATYLEQWDHLIDYFRRTYGGTRPVGVWGGSDGGWKALVTAVNRSVIGYLSAIPACLWENIGPIWTGNGVFSNLSWTGMDLNATYMNAVTVPGIIQYGTSDNAVGWAATTVAAGSNGVAVSTFAGAGTLNVAASTNMVVGPRVQVTGLTGGTGSAIIAFTGTGSGTLTGCTTVAGSGTLNTNNPVTQNWTDQIITNAVNAGQPVTRRGVAQGHVFTSTDAAAFFSWVQANLDPSYPVSF
jgi:hypothetical protein